MSATCLGEPSQIGPRMETIGPLPLTPPRNPYEGVSGGANEPRTEHASCDLRCVTTKKNQKKNFKTELDKVNFKGS